MLTPKLRYGTLCSVCYCLLVGCQNSVDESGNTEATANEVTSVYVVNYPLQYLAERIGGEHVEVVFPAAPGEDPAFWMPDADTVSAYQAADLILLNGASYAKWTDTVSLPEAKLINTSASFADRYIQIEDAITHSHGPGEHAHAGTAFTTWLDPQLALAQAQAVAQSLIRVAPQHQNDFQRNLAVLEEDLTDLDKQLQSATQDHHDTPLLFSHPVYQYLQRCCSLNGRSVHWEPTEAPTEAMWEQLQTVLAAHPAKLMVWEGQPAAETVARLQTLDVQSVVFAPCGNRPDEGDFLHHMRSNVEQLAEALEKQAPSQR